ncbi:MAG: GNAT family N-acetyltransferase [Verrucomicrobiales bacterium]|nr:GNAT family N-acetyltransferase [Verrucomicrobiales bacterium]
MKGHSLSEHAPLFATLESGLVVRLRPIGIDDLERVHQAYELLSAESRMNRFWEKPKEINSSRAKALVDTNDRNHIAWIALHESDDTFPGYAGASIWRDPENPTHAEITFTVADRWHRQGLATLLFSILWLEAWHQGIRHFHATARLGNIAILSWWESVGGSISDHAHHREFSFELEAPSHFLQKIPYEMPPSNRRIELAEWMAFWGSSRENQ